VVTEALADEEMASPQESPMARQKKSIQVALDAVLPQAKELGRKEAKKNKGNINVQQIVIVQM
jgi:hypothetical protein